MGEIILCTDPDCDGQEATTTCDDGCGKPVCEEHIHRDRETATRFCNECQERNEYRAWRGPYPPALVVKDE